MTDIVIRDATGALKTITINPGARPLLSNATATGAPVAGFDGGSYLWRILASAWNGATATLQQLGPDGATWMPAVKGDGTPATATADGTIGVILGDNATVRVEITAAVPTGVNSDLS